jgi:hypothetical protein
MPVYLNKDKTHIVYVSLKCAYTSMEKLVMDGVLTRASIMDESTKIALGIVRSPYKRLESVYKEKFIRNGNQNGDIHRLARRIFNIEGHLNKISYERFIKSLNQLMVDPHLFTQSRYLHNNNIRFFKLEENLDYIKEIIGHDLSKKSLGLWYHDTNDISMEFTYTEEMSNIINNLYNEDFVRFNYEKL